MFGKSLRNLAALGLVAVIFVAAGCDDDNNGTTPPPMPERPLIRVIHMSPDAPAVDVYVEGSSTPLFTNAAYGAVTAYVNVPAGDYTVEIRPAGADPGSTPVYTVDLTIGADDKITAIAAGLIGSSDPADQFRILPQVEAFGTPAAGNSIVRIVHASADAPTVAIDIGNDGSPEITDFERFADTGAAGVELPAGTALQIGIWAGNPLARVTAFTTPNLPDGGEMFVIAAGLVAKLPRETDGFSLFAVGTTDPVTPGFIRQNPTVYALHASPDAPSVDILVGGTQTELATDLAFAGISDPIQVPPAAYTLDFRVHGTQTIAATVTTPSLAAGERYLAVATGFVARTGAEPFQLEAFRDGFDLSLTTPLLRVVHSSPDAPAVDVGVVDMGEVQAIDDFTNLSFPNASVEAGTEVPAATLPIGVAATGTTTPVAQFAVTTVAGLRAFAVAAGALTPGMGEAPFQLLVVDSAASPWTVAAITD